VPALGDDDEEARLTLRSLLFIPGDSERKLEKGLSSGSDVLIVDLEDSVSPANKLAARVIAASFLMQRRQETAPKIFIRVNDLTTGLTDDDLAALVPIRPDAIMLPKSTGGQDVQQLSVKLRVHEATNGFPDGSIGILPLITETAASVLSANTYRGCSPRLLGVTWGAEDLSADIGASATRDAQGRYTDVSRLARSLALLAAA
jgi:citrate lyase subunit beta/citryl-CoA lyase